MDFLDPKKRRAHSIRLLIGYCLTGIAIIMTAVILVYLANGYGINTKNGEVIENGLLFVDSQPAGADIYLNGQKKPNTTGVRLVLNAGIYQLNLKKAGYREWSRTFSLNEHSVARYSYPFLWPIKLNPQNLPKLYSSTPALTTQSPDKHWLIVQPPVTDRANVTFDLYDTTKPTQAPQSLVLPSALLSNVATGDSYKAVEWSSDNNHLLIQHDYSGGSEFIIIQRTDMATSLNLNRSLNINPTSVALKDKKVDQVYVYQQSTGDLQLGDVAKAKLQPLLTKVLAYKPYGADLLIYATNKDVPGGKVSARIWENGKSYTMYTFSAGNKYLLDVAQFQSHFYYAAGSDTADRINIYRDPLDSLKNSSIGRATPLIALPGSGVADLSFSANTRFIGAQAGSRFAVYDIENATRYQYTIPVALDAPLTWMDGHRWIGTSGGQIYVVDFDNFNAQTLIPALNGSLVTFDKNYQQMFSQVATDGGVALQLTDLRAGSDLPKQ